MIPLWAMEKYIYAIATSAFPCNSLYSLGVLVRKNPFMCHFFLFYQHTWLRRSKLWVFSTTKIGNNVYVQNHYRSFKILTPLITVLHLKLKHIYVADINLCKCNFYYCLNRNAIGYVIKLFWSVNNNLGSCVKIGSASPGLGNHIRYSPGLAGPYWHKS